MTPALIGAALIAGLVGSGHCVAMCGGLSGALAMAGPEQRATRRLARTLLHNAGRLTSYSAAGALAGGLGATLGDAVDVGTAARWLRGASGMVLVLIGVQLLSGRALLGPLERVGARFWSLLSPLARRLMPTSSLPGAYAAGLLWGWLPCGLVYSMLLTAAVAGGAGAGAAVMAAFGLGTTPALLGTATAAGALGGRLRRARWRAPAGALIVVLGLWTAAGPGLMTLVGTGSHDHHGTPGTRPQNAVHGLA